MNDDSTPPGSTRTAAPSPERVSHGTATPGQEAGYVRPWWQKLIIAVAGIAVIVSLLGSTIFVVVSLRGVFG